MGNLRKICVAVSLFALWGSPTYPNSPLSHTFAGCVGRFSAELEHAWLMSKPETSDLEAQRLTFLSLLDATLTQEHARKTLTYRIEVKMAHASLLTLATFGQDAHHARKAKNAALRHITTCQNLLLDG
ncbi:MAG: hypothetical protein ABJL72_09190 [Roseobacter sp.]